MTTTPPEAVDALFAQLTASIQRDRSFAITLVGAAALERYGAEECRAYVSGLQENTFDVTVREVGEPERWDYTTGARTTTIHDAIPIEVERVARGETILQERHVTRADIGTLRWYSDSEVPQ